MFYIFYGRKSKKNKYLGEGRSKDADIKALRRGKKIRLPKQPYSTLTQKNTAVGEGVEPPRSS